MEVSHRLLERRQSPKYEILKRELDAIGATYKLRPERWDNSFDSIEFEVNESDPRYANLRQFIDKHGFYEQTGVVFSQREVDEAEWLHIACSESQYPQPREDMGYVEATYDTSKDCLRCSIGRVQDQPFRLLRDFQQTRNQFFGLHWVFQEVFLRPQAKSMLEESGITGITFCHPVYHGSGLEITSVFQMRVETIAAAGLATEGLVAEVCVMNKPHWTPATIFPKDYPACGRVKYNFPHSDPIRFQRTSLANMPDVVRSYEYFGSGGIAVRLILVSRRFYHAVKTSRLPGTRFTPVCLV